MPTYKLLVPSPQANFRACRARIQVFGGAFANGKTTAAVVSKALPFVRDYPGSNGLIARSTYPKLNDTIRREFFNWCPKGWIKKMPTQDDNTAYMVNGTIVNFRYIAQRGKKSESGDTSSNLLSATYDWIIVDQMDDPEISQKDFLDLLGRLRGSTPYRSNDEDITMPSYGPQFMILTCNPTSNWFYREVIHPTIMFRDRGIRLPKLLVYEDGTPMVELIEGDLDSNAHNLTPEFVRQQKGAYKGVYFRRFVKGEWGAFEGLVHPGFEVGRNTITREAAMEHLRDCRKRHVKLRALEWYDFGLVQPTCYGLCAVDDWGRVILLDGIYRPCDPDFDYTQHPAAIRAIRARYSDLLDFSDHIQADPAIFRRQVIGRMEQKGRREDTLAKLLRGLGLNMRPALSEVTSGIAKVNSYINGLPHVPHIVYGYDKSHKEDGTPVYTEVETEGKIELVPVANPLFYAIEDLPWFQEEIASYYWKKNVFDQREDEPMDKDDHAMNGAKYALSRLPEPSKLELPRDQQPRPWLYWHEVEERAA